MTEYFTQSSKYSVVTPGAVISYDTLQEYFDAVIDPSYPNTPVGYGKLDLFPFTLIPYLAIFFEGEMLGSRLLPKSLFNTTVGQTSIADAMLAGKVIPSSSADPFSSQNIISEYKCPAAVYRAASQCRQGTLTQRF